MTNKCYSYDGEEFEYRNLLDCICDGGLWPGDEIWEADAIPVTAKDLVNGEYILEIIGEAAYDLLGECAHDYLNYVPEQEKQEFTELICNWLDLNRPPNYWQVKNSKKRTVTQKEFKEAVGDAESTQ